MASKIFISYGWRIEKAKDNAHDLIYENSRTSKNLTLHPWQICYDNVSVFFLVMIGTLQPEWEHQS